MSSNSIRVWVLTSGTRSGGGRVRSVHASERAGVTAMARLTLVGVWLDQSELVEGGSFCHRKICSSGYVQLERHTVRRTQCTES